MVKGEATENTGVRAGRTIGQVATWVAALLLPILTALYLPAYLLHLNVADVSPTEAGRAVGILALISIALTLALLALMRSVSKALLVATLALALLLAYGQVYNLIEGAAILGVTVGRHRFLLPLTLGLILGLALWVWLRRPPGMQPLALASIAMACLVLWNVFPVVLFNVSALRSITDAAPDNTVASQPSEPSGAEDRSTLPDIYYIILDGHGREDILSSTYGYDGRPVREALETMGFFVAEESLANYGWTPLSLASSLNMTYLDQLPEISSSSNNNIGPARELVNRNLVVEHLRPLGYKVANYESGAKREKLSGADLYLVAPAARTEADQSLLRGSAMTEFEGLVVESTVGRVLFEWYVQQQEETRGLITDFNYEKHRERILYQFETLPDFAELEGPHFVFVHVMSPHPPFVFGPRGEEVPNRGVFSTRDLGCCDREEYIRKYRDQVAYVDRLLVRAVQEILDASEVEPIIIVQGDHGPSASMDEETSSSQGQLERLAILNAYLIPESCRDRLYPEITPVNSFRVVLTCLGSETPLLADRSYFSEYSTPLEFVPVENP